MRLRVMTWNIKTGGIDRGRGDRLDAIVAVLARGADEAEYACDHYPVTVRLDLTAAR